MTLNKILIGLAVLLLMTSMSLFSVHETQRAIKFQLGELVKSDYESGLHFKLPFIQNVKLFDGRIQTMDSRPERFLTAEKKNVIVDYFVKWRIADVNIFYTRVLGSPDAANLRLDQIFKDAFRSEFSKRNIRQLVSSDRAVIREILINNAKPLAMDLGVDVLDVQVMRIDLPEEVSSSVFRRMEAERGRVAREFRSQGSEAAERIRADADRQRTVTLANAYRDSEKLRGEGDAKSAEIYAQAYGKDPEFFSFYRSLSAYKKTFANTGMMVLEPDSEFFKYLKKDR